MKLMLPVTSSPVHQFINQTKKSSNIIFPLEFYKYIPTNGQERNLTFHFTIYLTNQSFSHVSLRLSPGLALTSHM